MGPPEEMKHSEQQCGGVAQQFGDVGGQGALWAVALDVYPPPGKLLTNKKNRVLDSNAQVKAGAGGIGFVVIV